MKLHIYMIMTKNTGLFDVEISLITKELTDSIKEKKNVTATLLKNSYIIYDLLFSLIARILYFLWHIFLLYDNITQVM